MKRLSVINHKGGVGKTTLTVSLLRLLSQRGIKVLGIDLDPQASLTLCLLQNISEDKPNSYNLLLEGTVPIFHVDEIDIIPSSLMLSKAEFELSSLPARELRLSKVLSSIKGYDLVIIDTPPNLGILTINSLMASDGIIIPLETQFFSLSGIKHLFKVMEELTKYTDKEFNIICVAPTFYEKNVGLHTKVLEELKKLPYPILPPIPKRVGFQYASVSKGDLNNLDKETLNTLNVYTEEVLLWLRKT
jgi:chromosome partitioning protein